MNNSLKKLLLKEIKSKKQIENLEDTYILEKINKLFLTEGSLHKKLKIAFEKNKNKIEKNKYFKETVKKIKKEIGTVYGSYLTKNFTKKEKLLEQAKENKDLLNLLKLHKSTRERVTFYEEIYTNIFNWYTPHKIADIACGLNPLSYFTIKNIIKHDIAYFASDINPKDMFFLNTFFNKFNIKGTAKSYDITDLSILDNDEFQTCDMIFLFKALDSFEQIKKNISKELLLKINAKRIVISFPTKSLISKQNFKIEKRNWLFNFLNKQEWQYQQFEIDNELFILIEK